MIDVKHPNYKKLHQKFVDFLSQRSKSNSTVIAYSKDIEQLLNFLSEELHITDIRQVTVDHLNAYKKKLEPNYTPKSISRKINSARTFFIFLLDNGFVNSNPAEQLVHPKFEVKKPRVLTETEYRVLRDISRSDVRLYSIVELLLQTGIRISELAALTLDDIRTSKDGKIRYLYIKEQGTHPARKVPLNNSAYQAIQEYLKIRPESENDTLFVTRNGNPLLVRNIRTAIDKAFEKANIKDAKVNDLRNTFIAHHLAHGVNLVTVSKLVGHKRISTTEKYLGLIKPKTQEDVAKSLKTL